jgi:hypothetical protein
MNDAMTADTVSPDLNDGVLMRLLAVALDKVQRRRRRPKKNGRLHRV